MPTGPLATAHHLLTQGADALRDATGPAADPDELLSVLTPCAKP